MDRRTRRDLGVASAIGTALVVATLGVGHVFSPGGDETLRSAIGGNEGAALLLAGGTPTGRPVADADGAQASDEETASGSVTATASTAPGASGTPSGAGGEDDGPGGATIVDDADVSTPGLPGSTGSGTATPGGSAVATPADPGDVGDGTVTTASVRLRVTDLSVTGSDSGTLRTGSEVRVRMTTARETVTTPASARTTRSAATSSTAGKTDAAATSGTAGTGDDPTTSGAAATSDGAATSDDPASPQGPVDDSPAAGVGSSVSGTTGEDAAEQSTDELPDRLDVRIRLDDAAVRALTATARSTSGPLALRALVDLVGTPSAGAGPYAVRVRMQLAPAAKTRAEVGEGTRTTDGVSNVVAVTAPIGTTTGATPGDSGSDDGPVTGDGSDGSGAGTGTDSDGGSGSDGDGSGDGTGTGTTPDATPSPSGETPPEPVEVRVPLPSSGSTTTPDDGASVGVPIPADATPPAAGVPATADAAVVVHVPAADEPLGGVPEDLTVAPPAVSPDAGSIPDPSSADEPDTGDAAADPADRAPDAPDAADDADSGTTAPAEPEATFGDDPADEDAPAPAVPSTTTDAASPADAGSTAAATP